MRVLISGIVYQSIEYMYRVVVADFTIILLNLFSYNSRFYQILL